MGADRKAKAIIQYVMKRTWTEPRLDEEVSETRGAGGEAGGVIVSRMPLTALTNGVLWQRARR